MRTRKLTLQEWFQSYQFEHLARYHLMLPCWVDVDVTRIAERWRAKGQRMPHTAILAKAMGLAALKVPEANSAYVRTFWGKRLVLFDGAHVNVPVLCEDDGVRYLNPATVTDVDRKSVTEISQFLREVRAKKLSSSDMPLTRLVALGKNTFLNRLRLRVVHFLAFNFPSLWNRRPLGGVSLSSLLNHDSRLAAGLAVAYGPTTITACFSQVLEQPGGKTVFRVGYGFDHSIAPGYLWRQFADTLAAILDDEALVSQFD